MNQIDGVEIIDPAALSEAGKRTLARQLYRVHERVFAGTDEAEFADYVVHSRARETKIAVYKSKGVSVGYCAVHRFVKDLAGQSYVVFRAEAGLLRAYRRRNSTFPFVFQTALRYKLFHPFRNVCYLGTFVHPSVYRLMTKYITGIYPNCRRPTPPSMEQLMIALAEAFHVPVAEKGDLLIREVGWITRDSEVDRKYWFENDQPDIRFFVSRNPRYGDGRGLVVLVPIKMTNLLMAVLRYRMRKRR